MWNEGTCLQEPKAVQVQFLVAKVADRSAYQQEHIRPCRFWLLTALYLDLQGFICFCSLCLQRHPKTKSIFMEEALWQNPNQVQQTYSKHTNSYSIYSCKSGVKVLQVHRLPFQKCGFLCHPLDIFHEALPGMPDSYPDVESAAQWVILRQNWGEKQSWAAGHLHFLFASWECLTASISLPCVSGLVEVSTLLFIDGISWIEKSLASLWEVPSAARIRFTCTSMNLWVENHLDPGRNFLTVLCQLNLYLPTHFNPSTAGLCEKYVSRQLRADSKAAPMRWLQHRCVCSQRCSPKGSRLVESSA